MFIFLINRWLDFGFNPLKNYVLWTPEEAKSFKNSPTNAAHTWSSANRGLNCNVDQSRRQGIQWMVWSIRLRETSSKASSYLMPTSPSRGYMEAPAMKRSIDLAKITQVIKIKSIIKITTLHNKNSNYLQVGAGYWNIIEHSGSHLDLSLGWNMGRYSFRPGAYMIGALTPFHESPFCIVINNKLYKGA